ncbi:MAG: PH domain-containing protein [bacterium]
MIRLKDGEHIVLEVRRHWYRFFSEVFFLLALAFIPLFFLVLFLSIDAFSKIEYMMLYLFFSAAWLLFVWISFMMAWTDYYLDVWIITNERLVDIEQRGLFRRDVSECYIGDVQDVRIEIRGLIPTVLNFGNIYVQTAGENREFIMKYIADPQIVKDSIIELHAAADKHDSL